MSHSTPWIVGALVAFFSVNGIGGYWFVQRIGRRAVATDQKLTDSGQALVGFKDLVAAIQEERREERARDKARIAELEAQVAALKAVVESRRNK